MSRVTAAALSNDMLTDMRASPRACMACVCGMCVWHVCVACVACVCCMCVLHVCVARVCRTCVWHVCVAGYSIGHLEPKPNPNKVTLIRPPRTPLRRVCSALGKSRGRASTPASAPAPDVKHTREGRWKAPDKRSRIWHRAAGANDAGLCKREMQTPLYSFG